MSFRRRQLKRALEPLRQALEYHRRSLEELESALIEFEETFNELEQRSGRPQVQQTNSSRVATIGRLRNRGSR